MTEEEKIKAAIKLLGPESRDDVEKALEIIDWQRIDILDQHEQQSKPSKKELIKYLAAMRKAAGAYYKLPSSYKLWLWELGAGDVDFKKEQRLCEKLLKETPVRKKGSSGDEKRIIAQEALNLIRKYKRSETLTRKRPSGLKPSYWLGLCAILYGDMKADFYHVCCEIKRPKPGSGLQTR